MDREIKIRDLFWYVMSHWKTLVVIVILGAIIGGGFSLFNNNVRDNNSIDATKDVDDVTVKQLVDNAESLSVSDGALYLRTFLTEADINSIKVYYDYNELYNDHLAYVSDLKLTDLKPYDSYYGQYLYYLKSLSGESIDAIISAYKVRLNSLKDKYGGLFSYSIEAHDTLFANSFDNPEVEMDVIKPSASLTVNVFGDSVDNCKSILDEIDRIIMELNNEYNNENLTHDIHMIAENCYKVQDTSLIDKQKTNIDYLNTLNNNSNSIYKQLSVYGQAFLEYLSKHEGIDSDEILSLNPDGSILLENKDNSESSERKISFKLVVLGAIVGFVIAIIVLSIVYCSSSKIRFEDDIELTYGLPCFGITRYGSKRKKIGLDNAIDRARFKRVTIIPDEAAPRMIAANIGVCLKDKGINKVYATGTELSASGKALISEVGELLKAKGLELIVGERLFSDSAEIEKMGTAGVIVLFESVAKAKHDEVYKTIQSCNKLGIKTLGIVLVG